MIDQILRFMKYSCSFKVKLTSYCILYWIPSQSLPFSRFINLEEINPSDPFSFSFPIDFDFSGSIDLRTIFKTLDSLG